MPATLNSPSSDKELVIHYCGDTWLEFSDSIPDPHVKEHARGMALILTFYPDSLLPTQFIELVVDERLDANMRSAALRQLIYTNMLDIINKMGVSLNIDYVELNHLPLLCSIVEFLLSVTQIDDAYQLVLPQLEASDTHPKYRFINALSKVVYDEEEPDVSDLECLIDDVSTVTLKMLSDSIMGREDIDTPPTNIINRVVANRTLLDGSLGFQHVRNAGEVGSAVTSYLNYFKPELTALLGSDNDDDVVKYGKDVISLYLISDTPNDTLKDTLLVFFDGRIDNLRAVIQIESIIKNLVIPVGETTTDE